MIRSYFPVFLRYLAAGILVQTLFFKFSGASESVWIFQQLGVEPWGRIGSGVGELLCALLLLVPRTAWLGAMGGLGVMGGAILSHLLVLGIEVADDGGLLFGLACLVFGCCALTLWFKRADLLKFLSRFSSKP